MLEKVQIGCPLHPHLYLSIIPLGFMLVNLPLTRLVLSHFSSKSCSYLLLTKRLRVSFFCLFLPWLLSLFALGISQMLAVKTVHSLSLICCPEQLFHQIFSRNPLWYPDTVSEVSSEQGQSLLEVLLHSVSPVCAKNQVFRGKFGWFFLQLKMCFTCPTFMNKTFF